MPKIDIIKPTHNDHADDSDLFQAFNKISNNGGGSNIKQAGFLYLYTSPTIIMERDSYVSPWKNIASGF